MQKTAELILSPLRWVSSLRFAAGLPPVFAKDGKHCTFNVINKQ